LIERSSALAPMIRNTDATIDPTAWATNSFTASTSDVRLVSSLAVVTCWM
jgi:hypothetical protein